jgi:catechol 2,3-dioxygenase-like lactoylglutathione lyase family enzyme
MPDVAVKQVVPLLVVKSMDASLRFYVDGLGFRMTDRWIEEGKLRWCWLEYGGAAVMLQEVVLGGKHPRPARGKVGLGVGLYFICGDALAFYREVRGRGITTKRPFVGNRMWVTSLEDPDGYRLHFESPTDAPEESEYRE